MLDETMSTIQWKYRVNLLNVLVCSLLSTWGTAPKFKGKEEIQPLHTDGKTCKKTLKFC